MSWVCLARGKKRQTLRKRQNTILNTIQKMTSHEHRKCSMQKPWRVTIVWAQATQTWKWAHQGFIKAYYVKLTSLSIPQSLSWMHPTVIQIIPKSLKMKFCTTEAIIYDINLVCLDQSVMKQSCLSHCSKTRFENYTLAETYCTKARRIFYIAMWWRDWATKTSPAKVEINSWTFSSVSSPSRWSGSVWCIKLFVV